MAKTGKTKVETAANLGFGAEPDNTSICGQESNATTHHHGFMNLPLTARIDSDSSPSAAALARLRERPSTQPPPPFPLTPCKAPKAVTFRKAIPSGPSVKSSIGSATEPSSTTEQSFWKNGTHHWTPPNDFSSPQATVLLDKHREFTNADSARNQILFTLKCNHRASNFFLLNWCQTNMTEIQSHATSTIFAEIGKKNFCPIRVVLSSMKLMANPTAKIALLYAQIAANPHESRILATLRDTLPPKLLSGLLHTDSITL